MRLASSVVLMEGQTRDALVMIKFRSGNVYRGVLLYAFEKVGFSGRWEENKSVTCLGLKKEII